MQGMIRYRFTTDVDLAEVKDSLMIAVMSVEGLHGRSRVRLEAKFSLNPHRRECEVETNSEVGQDLARIFTGLLNQQFGEEAFVVESGCAESAG
jgi:hypothetical protein